MRMKNTYAGAPLVNEEQNALNRFLDILRWFKNEIYNYLLASIEYAVQLIRYLVKLLFQILFVIIFVLGVIHVIWEYIGKHLI